MTDISHEKDFERASPPPDDPLQRHEELNADRKIGSEGKPLADLRLAALEHVSKMPTTADSESVAPLASASNWVQLGPTVIPKGQTYDDTHKPPARVQVTGRITSIVVDPEDPNTIYVGAAQGGVWKTTDRGRTWNPKTDNEDSLATGAIAIDPTNHLVLYVGTGEGNFSGDSYYGAGVLKTTDGGNAWTLLGKTTFKRARFCRIAVNPATPTTVFAATSFGVYRSLDGGENWTQMTNGLPSVSPTGPVRGATDVIIDPHTPDTAYAAFWGAGVYRTSNANAASPTWTKLTNGLPIGNFSRIALGIAPSSPQTLYALMADAASPNYYINQFYCTTDGGNSWSAILLPLDSTSGANNIGKQGNYNLNVAVDPTTPDIVYLSGISLWKATRNTTTGAWLFIDIGRLFHPDNHSFAFDPTNHQIIYAGSDGGIYTSIDAGTTWSDAINRGLCITQCEFLEQHPTSDAVIFIGTQDNGTEQFRNSLVFYHADDGDGGFVAIDQTNPQNVLSTYYNLNPKLSTSGGEYGSWILVSRCLGGSSVFYPPLVLDQSNQNNCAMGSDKIFLDTAQGTGGWPTIVTLPGLASGERISAINYTDSNLIYAGTELGKVYRLTNNAGAWTARSLHAADLPEKHYIWDLAPRPDNIDTVIVVMSGFDVPHVWSGAIQASGTATWRNISGTEAGPLPDIPVNSLIIESLAPDTMYIGTDVGVFRTIDGGTTWTGFSEGLPNCAIFDMRLHAPTRLLRVATHGRGVWERQLDTVSMPDVDIFVRDNIMHTGRRSSSSSESAAFADPLQHVSLGDSVWWWQCADIKIDTLEGHTPQYQMNVVDVDYVAFESKLVHRNPQRGNVNRVYLQVHNRGIQPATDVIVKVLYADASAGLPDLPSDFWTAFPGDSAETSHWKPIGTAQVIPSILPTEPAILEWEWNTPNTAADHSCLLLVTDCTADPIQAANKVLNIADLVSKEKHVGLKNLHVVDVSPGTHYWASFHFFGNPDLRHTINISQSWARGWRLGLLFEKGMQKELQLSGITRVELTEEEINALEEKVGAEIERYDTTNLYTVKSMAKGASLAEVVIPKDGLHTMLLLIPASIDQSGGAISIVQTTDKVVVGGGTFILNQAKL